MRPLNGPDHADVIASEAYRAIAVDFGPSAGNKKSRPVGKGGRDLPHLGWGQLDAKRLRAPTSVAYRITHQN
jgi:hypothetical protein